jgi:hypothetical protein
VIIISVASSGITFNPNNPTTLDPTGVNHYLCLFSFPAALSFNFTGLVNGFEFMFKFKT